MPAGSKPMPAAQPATSPTCYTSPIGHVLAAEGRISLQVEKTKREMYGGWLEHAEECEEDGWNIQRNVWRMGGGWWAISNSKVSCVLSTSGGRTRSITLIDSYCHPCF